MTLDNVKEAAACCTLCSLHENRILPVFDKGSRSSSVMICGMVPAHEENRAGVPFVGRAGKLLDKILLDSGLVDVYVTNIVKCCLNPGIKLTKEWVNNCIPYLINQICIIKPRVIITLGADASNGLLGTDSIPMGQLKSRTFDYSDTTKVIATYHPSYLLRGGGEKHRDYSSVVRDFIYGKNLAAFMNGELKGGCMSE